MSEITHKPWPLSSDSVVHVVRKALLTKLGKSNPRSLKWSTRKVGRHYEMALYGFVQDFKVSMVELRTLYDSIFATLRDCGVNPVKDESDWSQVHGYWAAYIKWDQPAEMALWDSTYQVGYAGKRIGLSDDQVMLLRKYVCGLLSGK